MTCILSAPGYPGQPAQGKLAAGQTQSVLCCTVEYLLQMLCGLLLCRLEALECVHIEQISRHAVKTLRRVEASQGRGPMFPGML